MESGGPALTLLNDCASAGAGNVRSLFVRMGPAHEALPLRGVSGVLQGHVFGRGGRCGPESGGEDQRALVERQQARR